MATKCGFLLLGLVLFCGLIPLQAQADRCENGWTFNGGSCYYREGKKLASWEDAQKVCEKVQANLVTVNDGAEQKFLAGLVGKKGSWNGLNYKASINEFEWVSGEDSQFEYWAPKEPRTSKNKRCVHMRMKRHNLKWVMDMCGKRKRYTCEKAANPSQPCANAPCKNGGTCIEQGEGYECQCPPKFTGNNCETEIVINPCDSNPCLNGGTCTATDNGYSCQCPDKFTGDNCEQSLDVCNPNPCKNGGTCYDIGNQEYLCVCTSDFTGINCDQLNCADLPCKNGGTCFDNGNGNSYCKCPSEFTGALCEGEVPSITQNPQDSAGLEGDEVTLCCKAEGTPSPNYQWFHDDAPLEESSSSLRLSGLSSADAGSYRCLATNDFGSIYSDEANLKVIAGSGDDSCDPTPMEKVVTLPPGCSEDSSGSNSVNVGTCSHEPCIKRGEAGGCGGQQSTRKCCSPAAMTDSAVSCTNGEGFAIQKVTSCACAECAIPNMVIRGRVVDADGNPVKKGEITVTGGERYSTDLQGNFNFQVKSGTKRLVLIIKDKLQGLLADTTKAFELHEGQVSFYTIVLQKKPPAIKFQATEEQKIPLGGSGGKPSFVDLDIPANAFLGADGSIYDGEITANIGVIDPRSQEDMAAAPGDFTAIGENGEELMLGTAGILRQSFTDENGNPLSLSKNITVKIDADMLDIPDGVDIYQWYLSKETGRWVKFGLLQQQESADAAGPKRQARKFFVGEITPDIPTDTINWDYVQTASRVRIRAPPGTVVTRIGLSDNGQYTSYRQETVPASGILCMLTLRDRPAILQAELNGAPLLLEDPIGFPAAVNPTIIDTSPAGSSVKLQSYRFTSTKAGDNGPVYLKGEEGRCAQDQAGDLAFEFQEANAGQLFHWESPRIDDPNDPRFWDVRADEICFIKALVTGSNPDSVVYVKSTGKAPGQSDVDYGYTAEKTSMVGSQGMVCLEYRCNEGPTSNYQTHLQVLTLTGTCTIQSLNGVLDGGQGRCPVSPDGSTSRERNFCVPSDLVGGDAGLYTGDPAVAKNRCVTGNNQYNSGRPVATTNNPTVTLNCS